MNKKHYYLFGEGENQKRLRFANEFTFYQPVDPLLWQPFYFKYFGAGVPEKRELPYSMEIKKGKIIESITIIRFIPKNEAPLGLCDDFDHYIWFVLAELSTKEQVILPCF